MTADDQRPDPDPDPRNDPSGQHVTTFADPDAETDDRGFFGRLFGGRIEDEPEPEVDLPQTRDGQTPGMGNLRLMRVDDVAIPKAEIVAVPEDISLPELVEIFREHGFSRVPVFRETLDSPLGLVHLKDLAMRHGFGSTEPFDLSQMLRRLLYVPPSMPIGVLLQQMQANRTHMALVIDEYGGADGLVTIEDLIEQVVGEIEDEHDETDGDLWQEESPDQWLIQARAPLDELESETGLRLATGEEDEEVDTVGGLIFMLIGRVPVRGEVISHGPVEFEIVDADPRRIKRVRLRPAGGKPVSSSSSEMPKIAS